MTEAHRHRRTPTLGRRADAGGSGAPSHAARQAAAHGTAAPAPLPLRQRRATRLALGVLALIGAVVLLVYGLVVTFGNDGGGKAAAPAAAGQSAGRGAIARFDVPAGWEDHSKDLADDVSGGRADAVFLGPSSNGFRSNLNVVRQPRGEQTPALGDLVTIVSGRVTAQLSAKVVGERRRLTLDGSPAIAYDYRYQSDGRDLRGRQVVTVRDDMVVFVNFAAAQDVFENHAKALDILTRSWHWG